MKHHLPSTRIRLSRACSRWLCITAVLSGASISFVSAQTAPASAPAAAPDNEVFELNPFTVTGSIVPRQALETPLAITSVNSNQLEVSAPRSTAEFLKMIPGIYTESSGGDSHNNIVPRGVFTSGGYRYTALLEDGLPVISNSEFQFFSADDFVRMSSWISTVEGLRGGTSGVYNTSAAVSTVNFIGREGTDKLGGEVKLSVGDTNLFRNDVWLAGPIGKSATFAIGGDYRTDNGARNPGYTANEGGQLNANVKYKFADDKGYFKVSAKVMNDRSILLLPFPLTGSPSDPKTIPGGPDIKTGSSASSDLRITRMPAGSGLPDIDLADGILAKYSYIGSELQLKPADGLTIENRNRATNFTHYWNSNPMGGLDTFQNIANSLASSAGIYGAAYDGTNYHYHLVETSTGNQISSAQAATLNGNGLGQQDQIWHTERVGTDIQDDLRVIKSFNDDKTVISVGAYFSNMQMSQLWDGVRALIDTSKSFKRYDLVYDNAATPILPNGNYNSVGQYTYNGLTGVGTFDFANRHDTQKELSEYVNFEQKFGDFSFDAGLRHTHLNFGWQSQGAVATDLNTVASTSAAYRPALASVGVYNGSNTSGNVSESGNAFTLGGNYEINHNLATFIRYSDAPRYHNADQAVGFQNYETMKQIPNAANNNTGVGPYEKIKQYELGIKYVAKRMGVYVTFYEMKQTNLLNSDFAINPVTQQAVFVTRIIDMKTDGVELEGTWTPVRGLLFDLRGTVQDPKIQGGTIQDPTNPNAVISLKGKVPTRLPKVYGSAGMVYTFEGTSWGVFSFNGTLKYTGSRPTALDNKANFSSFTEVAVGVGFATRSGFTYRIDIQNALDQEGITEGDPRASQTISSTGATFNARPILPRTIVASVNYAF